MKVTSHEADDKIFIYIDDLLHLVIKQDDFIGLQSYVKDIPKGQSINMIPVMWCIEFNFFAGQQVAEYDSEEKWKAVLQELDMVLTGARECEREMEHSGKARESRKKFHEMLQGSTNKVDVPNSIAGMTMEEIMEKYPLQSEQERRREMVDDELPASRLWDSLPPYEIGQMVNGIPIEAVGPKEQSWEEEAMNLIRKEGPLVNKLFDYSVGKDNLHSEPASAGPVLFITHDGKEVRKGDNVVGVYHTEDFKDWRLDIKNDASMVGNFVYWKWFSTAEAAWQYIDTHKNPNYALYNRWYPAEPGPDQVLSMGFTDADMIDFAHYYHALGTKSIAECLADWKESGWDKGVEEQEQRRREYESESNEAENYPFYFVSPPPGEVWVPIPKDKMGRVGFVSPYVCGPGFKPAMEAAAQRMFDSQPGNRSWLDEMAQIQTGQIPVYGYNKILLTTEEGLYVRLGDSITLYRLNVNDWTWKELEPCPDCVSYDKENFIYFCSQKNMEEYLRSKTEPARQVPEPEADKTILFFTSDGVPIREGDAFWFAAGFEPTLNYVNKQKPIDAALHLIFSTESAAQSYIDKYKK